MARFASKAELKAFLGKLDAEYASALWHEGIKTPRQLANFTEPHYLACGVKRAHIDDIIARADTTGAVQFVPCLCGLTVPDVCCATRDPNRAHFRPSIVLSPLGGQIAVGKQYVVDLEPVGQPVLSKYGDRKPKLQFELKTSIRTYQKSAARVVSTLVDRSQ